MNSTRNFNCDNKAGQVLGLAREVLGEQAVEIQVVALKFSENFEANLAKLDAKIVEVTNNKANKKNIKGEGVGLVDACFDAMINCYGAEYCSLDAISIVDFNVNAQIDRASKRKSDANVTVNLRVKNADKFEYVFACTTSSISHSSVSCVQESIGFFINAEMAYRRLYFALKDAQERGRHDLCDRFKNQMATLVQATSYEAIVEQIKNEDKKIL